MNNITKRIVKGVSGNILAQAANIFIQFAGVPLLLKFWGPEYYGEWLIIFTIPGFIENADFGLGGAAISEMSIQKQAGNADKVREILRSVFWFILWVGGIPFLLLYLSSWFLPWYDMLHLSNIKKEEFDIAFPCLIAYVYLTLFLTIPVGYYRVEQIYHRERYIAVFFKLLEFGGLVFVVTSGHGIVMAALTYLTIKAFFFIVVLFDLRLKFMDFRLGYFSFQFKHIRHLFKPSLALMVIFVGQNLLIQGITTTIGIILGPIQVVIFNTTRTLMNTAKQIVNIINFSFISEFSYTYGLRDMGLLNRLYRRVQQLNVGISFLAVSGMLLFGQYILQVWTHGEINVIQPFFLLFGVAVFINSFWSGSLVMLVATNKQYKTGLRFLMVSLFVMILIIAFIKSGGLTALASALILFEILMMLVVFRQCKETLGINSWNQFAIKRV